MDDEMLEIGRVAKPHGLRGEVIVELFTNRNERLAPGSVLSTPDRSLTVRRSVPHQHRWIVQFDGVDSREAADALHGVILSAEPIDDPDALWVHELIGVEVIDTDNVKIGKVTAVVANPAGDILEIGKKILVPLRFVTEKAVTEKGDGFIRIDPPAGLLTVNDD